MEWKTGRSYGVKTAPDDLEDGLEHQKKNQKNLAASRTTSLARLGLSSLGNDGADPTTSARSGVGAWSPITDIGCASIC